MYEYKKALSFLFEEYRLYYSYLTYLDILCFSLFYAKKMQKITENQRERSNRKRKVVDTISGGKLSISPANWNYDCTAPTFFRHPPKVFAILYTKNVSEDLRYAFHLLARLCKTRKAKKEVLVLKWPISRTSEKTGTVRLAFAGCFNVVLLSGGHKLSQTQTTCPGTFFSLSQNQNKAAPSAICFKTNILNATAIEHYQQGT